MEKDIETSFSRGKLLPSSVPSEKLPGKTTTPKKEKKLLVIQQITVKSTLKRTQKTSLSITSPSALPLLNYEELMTKDVWTQTESALSELLDHDGSIRKEELHSWQRVPNPLILWRSPLLPTLPPSILPHTITHPNPPQYPSPSFVALFLWLKWWSRHIRCVILLNEIMDLHMLSLGTLVPQRFSGVLCASALI